MTRRKSKPQPKRRDFPDGFFTALMRAPSAMHPNGFPPNFVSRTTAKDGAPVDASRRSTAAREEAMRAGRGYAAGTIPMPNTPTRTAPDWLVKMKAAR